MTEHAVVIAGGGPTGLVLAGELALAGVDVVIVERRATQDLDGSRAGGLHARTLEVLDQRGIAERFTAEGQAHAIFGFGESALPLGDLPTRHPYVLALGQAHVERILAEWVLGDLGVPILRGHEVVGFVEHATGVDVEVAGDDGRTSIRAGYLVGCDGGRSQVRKTAGIDFPGLDASSSWMIAELEVDGEPELGFRRDHAGRHALGRRGEGEPVAVVIAEPTADRTAPPTVDELRDAMVRIWGTDFGLRSASWISWFTDMSRQAAAYRRGRVLLAGDAAHVHPPQGGQGLNTGVQDAVNLGWKLARVVEGTSPDDLLDSYHAERHPVGARVQRMVMAQVALTAPDDRHQALRDTVGELLAMDEPRRHVGAMVAGLDVRYDLGAGHPLVGRRLPDVDLQTADGPTRASTLLHEARPVLVDLSGGGSAGGPLLAPWADRVRVVEARCDDGWELPVLGPVAAPAAVLVRPDGYVGWAGDPGDPGDPALRHALTTWCGPA